MLVYGATNCMLACIVNRCVFWFLRMAMWNICFTHGNVAYACLNVADIYTIRYTGSLFFTPLPVRYGVFKNYVNILNPFQLNTDEI